MAQTERVVKTVGTGLSVIYALTFPVYLDLVRDPAFRVAGAFILGLLLVLLIGSLGVVMFREWARQLLIVGNAVMGFGLLALMPSYPEQVEPFYIFVNLGAILFLSRTPVRLPFRPELKYARKSVLVIDDDEGFLKTVSHILLSRGYSVLTATSGERGIQIARLQQPDLIILDVILPGLKGREVCAALKQERKTRDIPVVFVTAKGSPDDVAAEMAVGADSHLTKPVDARTLLAAVKGCLRS